MRAEKWWNERQICFLYMYFTTRTMQRYVFTGWVLKNDSSKNRLLWTHNKRFMAPWFGVIAGGTGTATKKDVAFGKFNLHSNSPRRPQHRMARTKTRKKEIKKVLDLSKLTLFGIRDQTCGIDKINNWVLKRKKKRTNVLLVWQRDKSPAGRRITGRRRKRWIR